MNPGKRFLVGGAVRDGLMGVPVSDRDWVVIGATSEDMTKAGFNAVGADFPVFLHPESREEYALARTERKTAGGYHGFSVETKGVTLEDDLRRRDLTINAMAQDDDGSLIDPFGGAQDLTNKVLRHTSEAFAEDPVRVLRVARFAARWGSEWSVAPETQQLMRKMVENGELDTLTPERIWKEVRRALHEKHPSRFLAVLHECGALARILPEVDVLYGIPQVPQYHPEVDTGIHMELVVDQASAMANGSDAVVYAALVHDLGKGITPSDVLPKHLNHEENGVPLVEAVNARWKVPSDCAILGKLVCQFHLHAHRALEVRPGTLLELLEGLDAFRKPKQFENFVIACRADKAGRGGVVSREYPQGDYLLDVMRAARDVKADAFVAEGLVGKDIAIAMRRARLDAIQAVRSKMRRAGNEADGAVKPATGTKERSTKTDNPQYAEQQARHLRGPQ